MTPTPLLQAHNLSYRFAGSNCGIFDLSLAIHPAEKTAVMGANGSGKTTLFLTLNGTLRPHSGTIRLSQQEATYHRDFLKRWRQDIGLVLQDPCAQLIGGSVAEDIGLGPKNLGLSKSEIDHRVAGALSAMGLTALRNRSVHELSFGQKKRVAIAGILAMQPKALLLDEPTAGLDARGFDELLQTLEQLREQGIAIVLSTHDSDFAASWADTLLVLSEGRLVAQGAPQPVFTKLRALGGGGIAPSQLLAAWERLPQSFRAGRHPSWNALLEALEERPPNPQQES
jgi:cobalt/nickel transport system ATP-binding protein